MSGNAEWRSGVSFSERMDNISQMTEYLQSSRDNSDFMEARQNAHNTEMVCFNTATSEEEYDEMLEIRLQNIIANSKTNIQPNDPTPTIISPEVHGSLPTHAPAAPTKLIGDYTATYHATGSFSTVYRATDTSTNRTIALKVTTPSQSHPPHNPNLEIRILKHAAHPSIITLLSTFSLSTSSALVLTFPFTPLDLATFLTSAPTHVRKSGIFKSQVRSHLYSLFQALAHIHSLGIIHRDIKPSNILLAAPSGPAYLADFGIAWMQGDTASEKADLKITDVGTTCYRPPELLFGSTTYGTALDLWSAGCVVAEAVGGRARSSNSESGSGRELFDAGPAGSELGLIKSIFETLGTPNDEVWPEARGFSAWGKMQFMEFPKMGWEEVLPEAGDEARDLVAALVRFESGQRMKAAEVLEHAFFA